MNIVIYIKIDSLVTNRKVVVDKAQACRVGGYGAQS